MSILDEDRSTIVAGLTRVRFALPYDYCQRHNIPEKSGVVRNGTFRGWSAGAGAVHVWLDGDNEVTSVNGEFVEVIR